MDLLGLYVGLVIGMSGGAVVVARSKQNDMVATQVARIANKLEDIEEQLRNNLFDIGYGVKVKIPEHLCIIEQTLDFNQNPELQERYKALKKQITILAQEIETANKLVEQNNKYSGS